MKWNVPLSTPNILFGKRMYKLLNNYEFKNKRAQLYEKHKRLKVCVHFKTFFADSDAKYVVVTWIFILTLKAQKQRGY